MPDDAAPGTLCCLKMRPAGELSREECGDVTVEGEREVDREREPLLKVPVPAVPGLERGMCAVREDGCWCCAAAGDGMRSGGGHCREEDCVVVTLLLAVVAVVEVGSAVFVVCGCGCGVVVRWVVLAVLFPLDVVVLEVGTWTALATPAPPDVLCDRSFSVVVAAAAVTPEA
jgi:hypothetical protein